MPLLKIVKPEEAQGDVKEVYDAMMAVAKTVPKPLQMSSTSPELLKTQHQLINYFMAHPTLSFPLMAHIRYSVACQQDYEYCMNFNGSMLSMFLEVSDDQLEAIKNDPNAAALDDKEKALLAFVVKAIKNPESTTQAEVDQLRELGWSDQDIYEALFHGLGMVSAGIAFKALKMDEE
jgi:alkylhydroperoxidase/carboxymuconolactone decarboxylase family protein YurZ